MNSGTPFFTDVRPRVVADSAPATAGLPNRSLIRLLACLALPAAWPPITRALPPLPTALRRPATAMYSPSSCSMAPPASPARAPKVASPDASDKALRYAGLSRFLRSMSKSPVMFGTNGQTSPPVYLMSLWTPSTMSDPWSYQRDPMIPRSPMMEPGPSGSTPA